MTQYRREKTAENCALDEEDVHDVDPTAAQIEDDMPVVDTVFTLNGKPCSAVHPQTQAKYFGEPDELFDEFGFRISEEEVLKADDMPPLETSQHRMKWLAYVQFTHEHVEDELTWKKVTRERLTSAKLLQMLQEEGIPHSLRPFLWPKLSGATQKRLKSTCTYEEIVQRCEAETTTVDVQIDKDLLRTLPRNACFCKADSPGVTAMRRVLKAVAFLYPDLGYCQGMGVVVASLLIVCGEVNTFWIMCALIEDFLPPNFYSHSLLGLQADERVVRHLMRTHMPDLIDVIERSGADISLIVVNWLLTLLASVFPIRVLLRVWDVLFFSGGTTLFRAIISMLKLNEEKVVSKLEVENNSAAAFNAISRLPLSINEPEALLEVMISFEYSITEHLINELRKKFQGVIMAQNGMIFSQDDQRELPKQKIARRKLTRSKSVLQNIFHQSMDDGEEDDPKTKNIRQTEIIVDLKNAVNQICRYFAACVEKHEKTINMQADYRHKSYAEECKEFVKARREGRKRARALLEFQAQEGDELAFRKNDLITIISEKDEHCWVGELDGQRGWFPAKFVELIDERGKNYCILGDEAVDTRVSELVRGPLATTFRRVLFHGLRRSSSVISGHVAHPWAFIQAVSTSLMEQHNIASNSRLTLCDTFKLDQDGKVLSPEELLYRAVKSIDHTHNLVSAQLDVKLRSLVAYALNEQCLHLWFEVLCNSGSRQDPIRERFYQTWSFIRCPAWQQIKCELRLFAQLPFNLNVDSEVALSRDKTKKSSANGTSASKLKAAAASKPRVVQANGKEPLKEGVRDMLIKHHLFSWDL